MYIAMRADKTDPSFAASIRCSSPAATSGELAVCGTVNNLAVGLIFVVVKFSFAVGISCLASFYLARQGWHARAGSKDAEATMAALNRHMLS